jgi:hypothetical protein
VCRIAASRTDARKPDRLAAYLDLALERTWNRSCAEAHMVRLVSASTSPPGSLTR